MGKHDSGYARRERDHYPTPAWVVAALNESVPVAGKRIWEPAVGTGEMSKALMALGAKYVYGTDIQRGHRSYCHARLDFTNDPDPDCLEIDLLVTNPPFGERGRLAEQFIERGIDLMCGNQIETMCLLLPIDFDAAKGRRYHFTCMLYAGKVVLTRRIKWFDHPDKEDVSPKENHAWFIWRNDYHGDPRITYHYAHGREHKDRVG